MKSASTRNLSTSLSDGKLDIFEPSKAQSKLDALRKSQEIDKSLKRARSEIDEVRKSSSMVLLLGPGDSGISH